MVYFFVPGALCAYLLVASATTAIAQPMAKAEEVTNPAVFVPPVLYRSVFVDTPTGVEAETLDWKRANADVGQFKRGHIDVLKWEEEQAARRKAMPSGAAQPAPASGHQHGAKP